jgi:hypothetical protein
MASLGRKEYLFCNLEKKHFTEIIISKLVVENNPVIQHPKAILTEQKLFYEKLYKSSNPRHEELHNELFLNNDNPFISKPSQAEVYSCEGKITLQECLGALKNIKNVKSPDIVGCTFEF